MKRGPRKLIPEPLILLYHYFWAIVSAVLYGFPSRKLIVIGVTGTKGKTTAANYIWSVLNSGEDKAGLISTAVIRIGDEERLNDYHMTMPGRFIIQRTMREMVKAGCKYCVVETTSEGIKQYRHKGIFYNAAVFTNLSPEHLPSHGGSYDKYREAKGKLFASLGGKGLIVVNNDDKERDYYLSFPSEAKLSYGVNEGADVVASNVSESKEGVDFNIASESYHLSLLGGFNVYNALAAIAVGRHYGLSETDIKGGLESLKSVPGRMELIDEGQDFCVLVDYAHEGLSMKRALASARNLAGENKVIVILGAEGGGRDTSKRPLMGREAGTVADFVIVSAVDPYYDDPHEINEGVAVAAEDAGKKRNQDLFVINDRREAIRKALSLANKGDVVIITGKGSEQSMEIYGKVMDWDDRRVTREELGKLVSR